MGGGGDRKESENYQKDIRNTQSQISQQQIDNSNKSIDSYRTLRQPAINYYTALASGDPTTMLTAASVPLGNLTKSAQQARGQITENTRSGAARDYALSSVDRDQAGQTASFLNQAYLSAFPALAGLASEDANLGLQQLGAGERALEGSASTNQNLMQVQQQRKASQMGLIGSLGGSVLGAATGGLMGGAGATAAGQGTSAGSSLSSLPAWSPTSIANNQQMLSWMQPTSLKY